MAGFPALIARHLPEDGKAPDVVIGSETERGPWVTALAAADHRVYAINPMQVARYREHHSTSGAQLDRGDAHVVAELVRLDREYHRQIAGDADLAEAIKVLTRGHQNLVWTRQRHTNQLRSTVREYSPAALDAVDDLAGRDALAVLAAAPTPERGQALTIETISEPLRETGRKRSLEATAIKIYSALRADHLRALPAVAQAFSASTRALVSIISERVTHIAILAAAVEENFGRHPDAEISLSQPGLGTILSARALAELRDDTHRHASATARRNHAGTSPVTRASGTQTTVLARYARNRRLGDALIPPSLHRPDHLTRSPPPPRRDAGPRHRPQRRPAPRRQPARRHPPRLPTHPHNLRRGHRLAHTPTRSTRSGLTTSQSWDVWHAFLATLTPDSALAHPSR